MLDKRMDAVLNMLVEEVGYSYKVVPKQKLLESLPKRLQMDDETLVSIIAYLKEEDFVVVKYQDKEDICLTLTVKAESYLMGQKEVAVKSKITLGQVWILFLGVFLAALLGTLVAEVITNLLF